MSKTYKTVFAVTTAAIKAAKGTKKGSVSTWSWLKARAKEASQATNDAIQQAKTQTTDSNQE